MKKLRIAALILLFFFMLFVPLVKAPVLEGWRYSKILEFSAGSEGLQVTFNVTYGAASNGVDFNSQEDFDDLRFYDLYTGVLLAAWNQTTVSGEYVTVWIKLDESLSVKMYYGEDSAEPYWDIDSVFVDVIDNVVLALPMDEGVDSVVYDYSGNSLHGFVSGCVWVNGVYDYGLNFDGINDFVTIYSHDSFNVGSGNLSICVFGSFNASAGSYQRFIDKEYSGYNPSFSLFKVGNNLVAQVSNTTYRSDTLGLVDSGANNYRWQVFNGTEQRAILNSTMSIYSSYGIINNGMAFNAAKNVSLGKRAYSNDNFLNGTIETVFVFDILLSEFQRSNIMSFYPDCRIVAGSVCCRVWVGVMPSVSFGEEVSRDYAHRGEILGAAVVAILIFIPATILLYVVIRRR